MVTTEGAGTAPKAAGIGLPRRGQDRHRPGGRQDLQAATTARSRCPSPGSPPPTTRGSPSTWSSSARQGAASGGGTAGPVFRKILSYLLQKYAVPPTGTRPAAPAGGVVSGPARFDAVPDPVPDPARGGRTRPECPSPSRPRPVDLQRAPSAWSVRHRGPAPAAWWRRRHRGQPQLAAGAPGRPLRRPARLPGARRGVRRRRRVAAGAVAMLTDPAGAAEAAAPRACRCWWCEQPRRLLGAPRGPRLRRPGAAT